MQSKTMTPKRGEAVFNLIYLVAALIFGIYFVATSQNNLQLLWGVQGIILFCGDTFHLLPRMAAALRQNTEPYFVAMGRGKQIASITLSLFYVVMWQAGLQILSLPPALTVSMYVFTAIRIFLCFLPQNGWTSQTPSYTFSILRNIPFLLQGILIVWMYSNSLIRSMPGLQFAWLAVLISFECYMVVVLFAAKKPLLGMLMLPKTVAYLWLLAMGFFF